MTLYHSVSLSHFLLYASACATRSQLFNFFIWFCIVFVSLLVTLSFEKWKLQQVCVFPCPHYATNSSEGTCDDMFTIFRCSVEGSAKVHRTQWNASFAFDRRAVTNERLVHFDKIRMTKCNRILFVEYCD